MVGMGGPWFDSHPYRTHIIKMAQFRGVEITQFYKKFEELVNLYEQMEETTQSSLAEVRRIWRNRPHERGYCPCCPIEVDNPEEDEENEMETEEDEESEMSETDTLPLYSSEAEDMWDVMRLPEVIVLPYHC